MTEDQLQEMTVDQLQAMALVLQEAIVPIQEDLDAMQKELAKREQDKTSANPKALSPLDKSEGTVRDGESRSPFSMPSQFL